MHRRRFLHLCGSAGLLVAASPSITSAAGGNGVEKIDREALVRRHIREVTAFEPTAAWSVGNGEFAFTADVTGLQTFAEECEQEFPLCTTAHWAWHSFPRPAELQGQVLRLKEYDTYGRPVPYRTEPKGQEKLFSFLRESPHRLHLGRLSFELDGRRLLPAEVKRISQKLDFWTGLLESAFEVEGQAVRVSTVVHSQLDQIAVRVESPLLSKGRLRVRLAFPYGSPGVPMANWAAEQQHSSRLKAGRQGATIERQLDETRYVVGLEWSTGALLEQAGPHAFRLSTQRPELEFACAFASGAMRSGLPGFRETARAAAAHWKRFWTKGGVIDLSGSTDSRAEALEHRTVLSLYQTAIHCAGSLPSAETGLLCNSWYGKFHLEMHWWHSVHFTAWNRFSLFERSMVFYERILPVAQGLAKTQGYRGARWPKMVGPDGEDAPSPVGPLLIWQQPHPIYYAELCYRERPTRETLRRWEKIVFETAEFMASYAHYDEARRQFVLGPPMKTVSENTDPLTTINPLFELTYWRFGLRVAQEWRERLGLGRKPEWDTVLQGLAPNPQAEGRYLMQEGMADTYTTWSWEHPALVGALGMLPGDGIDPAVMRATVRKVSEVWQWERTWGWDFGMMAMACARSGEPELAIQALLVPAAKNKYWSNGHNYQRPSLTSYLPGNGSFLCAMAMMTAGWTGGPKVPAPGFPVDGQWNVRSEDLKIWL